MRLLPAPSSILHIYTPFQRPLSRMSLENRVGNRNDGWRKRILGCTAYPVQYIGKTRETLLIGMI